MKYLESRIKIHGIKDTKYMESRIQNTWNQGYKILGIKDGE